VLFFWLISLTILRTPTTVLLSCYTALPLIITWYRCSSRLDCSVSSRAYSLILSTAQPLSSRYAALSINYVNYLLVIINETIREQCVLILITNIDCVYISQKVRVQG